MFYRRQEAFRYTFQEPIDCSIRILKVDDSLRYSDYYHGKIVDVSPGGAKIIAPFDLSVPLKMVEIELHFLIDDSVIESTGELVWQKKEYDNNYSYGVKLDPNSKVGVTIVNGLKKHSRKFLEQKRNNQTNNKVNVQTSVKGSNKFEK